MKMTVNVDIYNTWEN